MGRYISWELDVVPRYESVKDLGSSGVTSADISSGTADINTDSAFVNYAERFVESRLAIGFTVPFSTDNITVKDLCIDQAFCMTLKYKDSEHATACMSDVGQRIDDLLDGRAAMITDSGSILQTGAGGVAWSSTIDYHPTFGVGDPRVFNVSSDRLEDEEDARQ